jgi:hypothetical protein
VKERKKLKGKVNRGGRDWGEAIAVFQVSCYSTWGHAVAQLLALRYKPEGRGLDSRWCHRNFSLTSFRLHAGVDSASNGSGNQEYILGGKSDRCLGLINLAPSCADCLEIRDPQPPGTLRAWPGL